MYFKPGCVYRAQGPIPSLEEFLNGNEMSDLRQNKLCGSARDPGCSMCWGPESLGLPSIRQQLLKKPWATDEIKIRMLDVFFGNTCNLGCLMCGPDWSSFSSEERYQAGLIDHRVPSVNTVQVALDTMDQLPDLESVTFLGGEFFLVKDNVKILDKIIQRQLQCTITTNATVMPEYMLEKLKQVRNLQIRISTDGTAGVYEFIRYPAQWATLNQNVDLLKSRLPHAEYHFSIVVQPLNIQTLPELLDWSNRKLIPTHYQMLHNPSFLSWQMLYQEEKDQAVELLNQKQKLFKLTSAQKELLDDLTVGVPNAAFNNELRLQAVNFSSKILNQRKISPEVVRAQFGLWTNLSDQIIDTMQCKQP